MTFQEMMNIQAENETKSLRYKNYFRVKQTFRNTSLVAPPGFNKIYFTPVSLCRLSCQVINERIDIDSWFTDDEDANKANEFLAKTFKVNALPDLAASAHLAAMEFGRAYLVPTGSDREDGIPMIDVVPGRDMVHRVDAFTGELIEALQVFGEMRDRYSYWTPGRQSILIKKQKNEFNATVILPEEGFVESDDFPGFWEKTTEFTGKIPVFPVICRGEPGNTFGRPEAKDIFGQQDAACRYATDMSIASALLGVPKEFLIGAEAKDFVETDENGNPVEDDNGNPATPPSNEDLYMARLITLSDPNAKLVQTQAAQLQNFATALNTTLRQASATMAVPISTFGIGSDANPASGDAKQEDDKRLVRRAEQLTRGFEPGWVDLGEYLLLQYGYGDHEVAIRWTDPSLPNLSGRADAVLKLSGIKDAMGNPLYTWQELRRKLGDKESDIRVAEEQRELQSVQQILAQPEQTPQPQPQGAQPNEQGTGTESG